MNLLPELGATSLQLTMGRAACFCSYRTASRVVEEKVALAQPDTTLFFTSPAASTCKMCRWTKGKL